MSFFNLFRSGKDNRTRVIETIKRVNDASPLGWDKVTELAVGGLTEVGFSKSTNLLLIVSSSGRSVVDCYSGRKVSRDYETDGNWYDPANMQCRGIGSISGELIAISGLCGGGLPKINRFGESIEVVAPDWPIEDVIFCPPGKSALIADLQQGCCRIFSENLCTVGFSWDGIFLIIATSSDVIIWKKIS